MQGLAMALLVAAGRLPARRRLGALLGRAAMAIMRRRRRVAAANLRVAFPTLSAAERAALLRRHFAALGAAFMDSLWALSAGRRALANFVQVEGEPPAGGIVLIPHFLGFDLALLRLADFAPQAGVYYFYKPMHNRFWRAVTLRLRERFGARGFSASQRGGLLRGARAARAGGLFCFMPDIDPKMRKSSVFAPFLGVARAATTTALSRLAGAARAPVCPLVVCHKRRGYVIKFLPPLENFPGGDAAADAARVNALVGEWAQKQPQNYYWLHRRFKTAAAGDAPVYEQA